MTDPEVRELREFHAVAEELNFAAAAQRLGTTPEPLLRTVESLESRLGVRLLERDCQMVTLTAAGQTLSAETARVLDAVAAAWRRTVRAALPTPTLLATAKPGVTTDLLRQIVWTYHERPAVATVEMVPGDFGEQAAMVRDGRADVAVLGLPMDQRGLEVESLTSEPRVVVLAAGHALATRTDLRCADLSGLPVPCWPGMTVHERTYWAGQDRQFSATPVPEGPVVRDGAELLDAVARQEAVALVPISLAARNQREDLTYRPVADASPYETVIAWPDGAKNRWIAQFARTALEVAAGSAPRGAADDAGGGAADRPVTESEQLSVTG